MPEWKKETPTFIDWDKQDEFVGILAGKDVIEFRADKEGDQPHLIGRYEFVGQDGERYSCLGGKILDEAFDHIAVDTVVRIVSLGKQKTHGGQTVGLFEVFSAV